MKHAFIDKDFRQPTLDLIAQANEIIEAYQAQGYMLTLRQLYYQFVARALLPNTVKSYNRLGEIINAARLAGLVDWAAIEDRTRHLERLLHFDGPKDAVETVRDQYHIDMWQNQAERVEVWIEKAALIGVIAGVCRSNDVPYFACIGYVSQSEMYAAGRRARDRAVITGQTTIILHLGDHDPSGIDMTRDNEDRLQMFARDSDAVRVRRLALTMDQIEELKPPPNPAKTRDSRYQGYRDLYGDNSWELDALEPDYMVELIRKNIDLHRDPDDWQAMVDRHAGERDDLDDVIASLDMSA